MAKNPLRILKKGEKPVKIEKLVENTVITLKET